jgi:hypothetical protein
MKLKVDDLNSILTLVKATGNYTYNRIYSSKDAAAYRHAMKDCISTLEEGLENLDLIRHKVECLRSEPNSLYKDKLFNNKSSERRYYLLAVNQTIEVIDSIKLRFITGDTDSSNYVNKISGNYFLPAKVFV